MSATAELPSRWTTATDAAPHSTNTSTPPVTTIDDSSSNTSNTFYGLYDSLGGSAPGQLQQLINFADLAGGQPQQQQQQHNPNHHHHLHPHQPQPQHVVDSQDRQQLQQLQQLSATATPPPSAASTPSSVHQLVSSSSAMQPQLLPPMQTISFNGLIPQHATGTIRSAQTTTQTTTTTNGLQQIFHNLQQQTQLQQQQQQQQQQILLQHQQQQQQLANLALLQQQQQQQQQQHVQQHQHQQLATQLVNGGGHGMYNLTANSVSGQFKVEPITDAALCLQEHFRQQQQQIALQTQLQLQYQLQQQQQQQASQLMDLQQQQQQQQQAATQFMQLPQGYNAIQFQGMVAAMAMQQQPQQQPQSIVVMGADGRTYHAVNRIGAGGLPNGELEMYVETDNDEEEEEEGDEQEMMGENEEEGEGEVVEGQGQVESNEETERQLIKERQQQRRRKRDQTPMPNGCGTAIEEREEDEQQEDPLAIHLPMTTTTSSSSSSNHCDIVNGGGGGGGIATGPGIVITRNGIGGVGQPYQQIQFYDRATGRITTQQGPFNPQQQQQHHQIVFQQQGSQTGLTSINGTNGLINGVQTTGGPIQLLMPAAAAGAQQQQAAILNQSQQRQIAYQQVNQQHQQLQQQQQQVPVELQPDRHRQQHVQSILQPVHNYHNGGGGGGGGSNAGKKIKPVLKPGLVLKTPIAFQGNVDPSQIPIQRDGMAVCERCGAIGVKHSFYTKFKSFCSLNCARNFEEEQAKRGNGTNSSNIKAHQLKQQQQLLLEDQSKGGSIGGRGRLAARSQCGRVGFRRKVRTMNYDPFNDSGGVGGDDSFTYRKATDILYRDLLPQEDLPELVDMPTICPEEDRIETVNRRKPVGNSDLQNSYDWGLELRADRLGKPPLNAAPVTCFKHVPGYDIWSKVVVNMKVEVENTDCDNGQQSMMGHVPHSFWVATVLQIRGYKALLRYEGFDDTEEEAQHDFWVNLCSSEVHNVGWCATRGKPLIPPKSIEHKYSDWKQFLMQRLYNARTLSSTFYNRLSESLKSRFRPGQQLEIVDKEKISRVRLATVEAIVGKRLHVRYNDNGDGFFCHEDSALIHHVGWAMMVGHKIKAPMEYMARMSSAAHTGVIDYEEDDATVDLFKMNFSYDEYYAGKGGLDSASAPARRPRKFREGMKLEAIDPLNPSSICVASVMSVLKFGYLMIRIDVYEPLVYGDDWFCYHESSPYIFPVGFCQQNQLELTPPKGYDSRTFNWEMYLRDTRSIAATASLFEREVPRHNFEVGMKIECADLMDPKLVCVATVSKIVGRLMRINFDGWEDVYDQWLDVESPDMYPVGWCFLAKHRLEAPKSAVKPLPVKGPKKRGRKKIKVEEGEGTPSSAAGSNNKGKGKGRMKAIKVEPQDDPPQALTDIVAEKEVEKQQQSESLSNTELMIDTEELELLKESRRFGTRMDLEDSTSHLMGEEYSLSAVGGESLMADEEGEEEDDEEDEEEQMEDDEEDKQEQEQEQLEMIHPELKGADFEVEEGGGDDESQQTTESETTMTTMAPVKKGRGRPKKSGGGSVSSTSSALIRGGQKDSMRVTRGAVGEEQEELVGSSTTTVEMDGNPELWTVAEVCQFLTDHDCAAHCESFKKHLVDGKSLIKMSKDDIITVLGMKVGPALKIFDLIQQLKDPFSSMRRK